jgi:signal transduction histidine kinase
VKNSIEALSETSGGKIVIKEYYQVEKSIIEVIDNGPGIAPENIDEVFIPFYTTKEEGSGIGLSLSKQIMNLHCGSLSVSSTPGVETSFRMIL